ncbi:tachykinin-like peptides receptor 99D [Portunus trituberculatus]|uniref:tachykinin-like peptides receptor 99D n=1 Tax=Portunus trituberculatus TaxID=210409 RepID=UPI001E1CFE2E|nr:tachykinin-like peptides receptor 99D [Portunus trituberculatus]
MTVQHYLSDLNLSYIDESEGQDAFNYIYNGTVNSTGGDSLYEVPVGIVVLLSLFYGSISLVAVVGNALVIWIVATSRKMHSVTNYFIANLALADIIIGLFSIPFNCLRQFFPPLQQLTLYKGLIRPCVEYSCVNVSVFTLTAIAIDRYRAIVHPLTARPTKFRSKVVIAFIWIFSITLAMPNAIVLRVTDVPNPHTQDTVPRCEVLWGTTTPGNAEGCRDAHLLKNKKKVIKMLLIVVALFGICWAPLQTYHILQEIYPHINL